MIHDWWAVELRSWAGAGDGPLRDAIEHVLELAEAGPDCSECLEAWLDEGAFERIDDDFPQALTEEHVIRILALEDALLVRHGLEQWLTAVAARRRREAEEKLRDLGDPLPAS